MIGSMLQRRSFGLLLLAFLVLSAGQFATFSRSATAAELSGSAPLLIRAASPAIPASNFGTVVVTGDTFTPGGAVYIALYDTWGERLYETRWTTASAFTYGYNGSADPAYGYIAGGTILESFDHLCGGSVMVRAYDQSTDSWSNWLDAKPHCSRQLVWRGVADHQPRWSLATGVGDLRSRKL